MSRVCFPAVNRKVVGTVTPYFTRDCARYVNNSPKFQQAPPKLPRSWPLSVPVAFIYREKHKSCICGRGTRVLLLRPLYRLTHQFWWVWIEAVAVARHVETVCFCQNKCSQALLTAAPHVNTDYLETGTHRTFGTLFSVDSCKMFSRYWFGRKVRCGLNLYSERSARLIIYLKAHQGKVLLDLTLFLTP